MNPLTVGELIAKLMQLPADRMVFRTDDDYGLCPVQDVTVGHVDQSHDCTDASDPTAIEVVVL